MDSSNRDTSEQPQGHDAKRKGYPLENVVGALDPARVESALKGLTDAGFNNDQIQVVTAEDVADLENPIDQPGVKGFLARLVLSFGVDVSYIERLRSELRGGDVIVMVAVDGDDEKSRAGDILRKHDADSLSYVGRWTIEGLA